MSGTLGTLERGLKLLDLLVEIESDPVRKQQGISVQQAATELAVHKSSASRLLQTLTAAGWAEPVKASGRGFRLGPAVQSTSSLKPAQRRFRDAAHPYLERLAARSGECAHAAVAAGAAALVVDDVETEQPLRVVAGRGRRVPLHCTSAGKALLAFDATRLPLELPARTARTLSDRTSLEADLDTIRSLGYAVDDEENHDGVRCISAPVLEGARGRVVGCVGIDGPSLRVTLERVVGLAELVVETAVALSLRLEPEVASA